MKRILFVLIVLFSVIRTYGQLQFSDSLRISLLTVADGQDAYECFGHTGLRVNDLKKDLDIVFHYGVYNYTEPNFIWHFVEGKCNYSMGACYADDFFYQHKRRQLDITEQTLSLDSAQCSNLVRALIENYAPRNRNYRYNFFFDNCATRPFEMINRWAEVQYDTTWIESKTLRDMIQEKTGKGNWLDFGISLTVAGRADQQTLFKEQMFLPSYLSNAIAHAVVNEHPLVTEVIGHENGSSKVKSTDEKTDALSLFSPTILGWFLLVLAILISIQELRGGKPTAGRSFDSVWLFATGLAGCIVWFLNFFSEHPAVDNNLNCMWLLPTNLLFLSIIWIKKAKKVRRIYFFIIFAAEITYIISVSTCAQYFHPAFLPMLLTIGTRSACGIKTNR